jgi:hypothetical protein
MFSMLDMLCNSLIAQHVLDEAKQNNVVVLISILAEEKGMSKVGNRVEERKLFDLPVVPIEHPDVLTYYIGLDCFVFCAWESTPMTNAEMDNEGVCFGPFYSKQDAHKALMQYELGMAECALAMDDFEDAQKHNLRADALMHAHA